MKITTEVYPAPSSGTFSTLRRLRREDREKRAREARERRLSELQQSITALEQWHHAWRLEHDEDYRALHPGEWCEYHEGSRMACDVYCHDSRSLDREIWRERRESARRRRWADEGATASLSAEERRAAALRMAEWGKCNTRIDH